MKRMKLFVWVFAALGCVSLQAQTVLTAKIPFDFQLGKKVMPAGEYRIEESSGKLLLRCRSENAAAFVLTMPTSRQKKPETGLVEFNRYGNTYFFEGIRTPYSSTGAGVMPTSHEKELARRVGTAQPAAIALNTGR